MMQTKLVENWLTNVKEISFTAPFVQLLLAEGYTVIQSKGGIVEQGKDIIAKDSSGKIHCFQLKCGNIGNVEWQAINGQLNDLTGIAPTHPSITTPPKHWECHLVTNGDVTGPVSKTITDYSNTNKASGRMQLQTITKDELLRRFTDAFGNFFPIEPNDIRIFFEMFCEDGDNILKSEEFKNYFEGYLTSFDSKSKQKRLEAIQATPILASYLLTDKYSKGNHIASINAWVLVLLTILYYANKWSLDEKKYLATEKLILDELERLIEQLLDDIVDSKDGLLEMTYGAFSEPIITLGLRCTELLGYIYAAINYSILSKRETPRIPKGLLEKVEFMIQRKVILSETSIPSHFNVLLAFVLNNNSKTAIAALQQLIDDILSSHTDNGAGLISPYYTTEDVMAHLFNVGDKIEESFQNRSYMLWTAILVLTKYDQRDFLNDRWSTISKILMEEIVAHDQNDLLLWRADSAEMIDTFPRAEQSWSGLKEQANKSYDNEIPSVLLNRKYLIPLMIMAMPHRLTPKLILSLVNNDETP